MKRVQEEQLKKENVNYCQSYWRWLPPNHMVESRQFNDDQELEDIQYGLYMELHARRLNEEVGELKYFVGERMSARIKQVTVLRLED